MAEFDFDSQPDVSADDVLSVAEAMGRSPSKSDEQRELERLEVEAHLFEARQRDEQRRLEFERRREEAGAAKIAQQRQTAALERQDRTRQLQDQMRRDSERQMQSRQLADLHRASIEQQQFRRGLMRSQANAAAQQSLSDTLDSWWNMKYPPPPAPEPAVVVVEQEDDGSADFGSRNFDVAKWSKKPRSWW